MTLSLGDLAKDCEVLNENNEQVALSTLWQTQPVALFFVRHFG